MLLPADIDSSAERLLLEMAFQTQGVIAFNKHPRVDRAVRVVASRAAFAHCLVFEHEGTALRNMTFAAGLLLRGKRRAAPDNRVPFVRIVTVAATEFSPCRDWPAMGTVEHRM